MPEPLEQELLEDMVDRVVVVASPEVIIAMPLGAEVVERMIVVDNPEVTGPEVVAEMEPTAVAVAVAVVLIQVVEIPTSVLDR